MAQAENGEVRLVQIAGTFPLKPYANIQSALPRSRGTGVVNQIVSFGVLTSEDIGSSVRDQYHVLCLRAPRTVLSRRRPTVWPDEARRRASALYDAGLDRKYVPRLHDLRLVVQLKRHDAAHSRG